METSSGTVDGRATRSRGASVNGVRNLSACDRGPGVCTTLGGILWVRRVPSTSHDAFVECVNG
jgi:hypothetical protein